jgi:hypothetical protein
MSSVALALPRDAAELLERERVPLADACRFLGMTRQAAAPKAKRYVKRVESLTRSGKPFDTSKLRPQRDKHGRYIEIPAYWTAHGFMVRCDLLVGMAYPEAAFAAVTP